MLLSSVVLPVPLVPSIIVSFAALSIAVLFFKFEYLCLQRLYLASVGISLHISLAELQNHRYLTAVCNDEQHQYHHSRRYVAHAFELDILGKSLFEFALAIGIGTECLARLLFGDGTHYLGHKAVDSSHY